MFFFCHHPFFPFLNQKFCFDFCHGARSSVYNAERLICTNITLPNKYNMLSSRGQQSRWIPVKIYNLSQNYTRLSLKFVSPIIQILLRSIPPSPKSMLRPRCAPDSTMMLARGFFSLVCFNNSFVRDCSFIFN